MICPTCHVDAPPAAQMRDVMICSQCAETVVGDRKAVYEDVKVLSDAEMTTLRKARLLVQSQRPR